jgi:hypothetical protein
MKYRLMNEMEGDGAAEGSGSLLSTAAPVAEAVEAPVAAPGPAVERPEWLLDKYATNDREQSEAISEQAKAYVELQKQFGGFTGAPEEYEFTMPEGVEGDVDTELEAFQQFTTLAKEANMSQETAQQLFGIFVGYQNQIDSQYETDLSAQKEMLGPQADQRIQSIASWAGNNLTSDDMSVLESMTTTAAQVETLERIIGKTRNSPIPKTHEVTAAPSGFSQHDFEKAVNSDRFKTDAGYRAEIRKKASQLFPGS